MSFYTARKECDYNGIPSRRKRDYVNDNVQVCYDLPERDIPKKQTDFKMDDNFDYVTYSGHFPPPEPPMGQYGSWDLQFCKWWGWTWVKKQDKPTPKPVLGEQISRNTQINMPKPSSETNERPVSHAKKKKCQLFSCFKKQPPPKPVAKPDNFKNEQIHLPVEDIQIKKVDYNLSQVSCKSRDLAPLGNDRYCCRGNMELNGCCPCNQGCCPCNQGCCPCNQGCCPCNQGFCPCNQGCCPCNQGCCPCNQGCCPCNQGCCPCIQPMCCCNQICCPCTNQMPPPPEPRKRKDSKTIETQTLREMKEQATKMSEMCVPKKCRETCHRVQCCKCRPRKCMCMRPVCCPCKRNMCCPCIQQNVNSNSMNSVDPSNSSNENNHKNSSNNIESDNNKNKSNSNTNSAEPVISNDAIINYCLTHGYAPSVSDLLKLKTSNFSSLRKSVDILLKNNINIMSLFNENKTMRNEEKHTFLDSSDTISFLPGADHMKRPDKEHYTILTAVCDAILSNHKFDDDKYRPLIKESSSKSTQKSSCESKDSSYSFIAPATKSILEKIFTQRHRSDDINVPKETDSFSKFIPSHSNKRSSFSKGINRYKLLTTIRHPKKIKGLRRSTSISKILSNETKNIKRDSMIKNTMKSEDNRNVKFTDESKNGFKMTNDAPKKWYSPRTLDQASNTVSNNANVVTKETQSTSVYDIEKMLTSISFTNLHCKSHEDEKMFQDSNSGNLIEATSPPFTDYELAYNTEDNKQDMNFKHREGSFDK